MRKLKKVRATREELVDLLCDCCGTSCWDSHKLNFEFALFEARWGYYSQKDGTSWHCDLCEDCAGKVKAFIESLGGEVKEDRYI